MSKKKISAEPREARPAPLSPRGEAFPLNANDVANARREYIAAGVRAVAEMDQKTKDELAAKAWNAGPVLGRYPQAVLAGLPAHERGEPSLVLADVSDKTLEELAKANEEAARALRVVYETTDFTSSDPLMGPRVLAGNLLAALIGYPRLIWSAGARFVTSWGLHAYAEPTPDDVLDPRALPGDERAPQARLLVACAWNARRGREPVDGLVGSVKAAVERAAPASAASRRVANALDALLARLETAFDDPGGALTHAAEEVELAFDGLDEVLVSRRAKRNGAAPRAKHFDEDDGPFFESLREMLLTNHGPRYFEKRGALREILEEALREDWGRTTARKYAKSKNRGTYLRECFQAWRGVKYPDEVKRKPRRK